MTCIYAQFTFHQIQSQQQFFDTSLVFVGISLVHIVNNNGLRTGSLRYTTCNSTPITEEEGTFKITLSGADLGFIKGGGANLKHMCCGAHAEASGSGGMPPKENCHNTAIW